MKKLFNREQKSSGYFHDVKAAQKQDKPETSIPGSRLRTDRVPSSNVQPAKEGLLPHHTLRSAVGVLLGLVILGLILYTTIGPGRPMLEKDLANLVNQVITPTYTLSPTPITPTVTPVIPTKTVPSNPTYTPSRTPKSSPTLQPTRTPLIQITQLPTVIPSTPTPTGVNCREATSITLSDVGQFSCVKGLVVKTITNQSDFMVLFSFDHGSFYWVTYDLVWKQAELNTCYQLRGEILRLGNNPIMVFDYRNLPEVCP